MIDRLRGINSVKYLEDSLALTQKEKELVKEFLEWLPTDIIDSHTRCNLTEHVLEVDDEMYTK